MLQPGPSTATNQIKRPHRQLTLKQKKKKTTPKPKKIAKGPVLSLNMAPRAVVPEGWVEAPGGAA